MIVQQIQHIVKDDVETITGNNFRYILIELDQPDIFQVKKRTTKNEYKFTKTQPEDEWKIPLVKELTDCP